MTQAHGPRPQESGDVPPRPSERVLPQVPAGSVPVLDEDEPPDPAADDIPELPLRGISDIPEH